MNDILKTLRAGLEDDTKWEELLAMADYDEAAMRDAYMARDFAELGRLTAWALDQRLADEAFWAAEKKREDAARSDNLRLAEHAEELSPNLASLLREHLGDLRGLMPIAPCSVTGDGS